MIKEQPAVVKNRAGNSVVEMSKIFIGSLFSGSYDLIVSITDNSKSLTEKRVKRFYVHRPADYLTISNNESPEQKTAPNIFLGMSEEELDNEFEIARYITTSQESELYSGLNLNGKREFMYNFWMKRNIEGEGEGLNYRKEYLARTEYADQRFSVGDKEGWKTERGRIVLLYGIPNDIERYTTATSLRSYEIWFYESIQGGGEFVFVDVSGFGDKRLVHSSVLSEIQDYDWQRRWLQ